MRVTVLGAGAWGTTVASLVGGVGDGYRLRLANLVQQDGSELIVNGTDGEDRFEFDAAALTMTVNGLEYTLDHAELSSITFAGGRLSDTGPGALRAPAVTVNVAAFPGGVRNRE